MKLLKYFSPGALVVMAITFVLFTFALVVRGVTHDLLLEAAVFLVSIKLMLMTYRNTREARAMSRKLDRIYEAITHPVRHAENVAKEEVAKENAAKESGQGSPA